jgi:hypothetical protein
LNFVFYQVGWFACVLGMAYGLQWLGMTIALALVGLHLCLSTDRGVQVRICLAAALFGLIIDTGQFWAGVFTFPEGIVIEWLPPPTLAVLWIQFATTFRYSMSWLSRRYAVGALFGLFGAPLAYFAGERFGAIEFLPPRMANFVLLGVIWSVAVPALVYLSDRWATRWAVPPGYRWPSAPTLQCNANRAESEA